VIYLTNSHDTLAVDATTCAAHWRHEVSRLSFRENGKPSLVIYALAENTAAVADAAPLASNNVPTTAPPAQLQGDAVRGGDIYQKNYAACQGGHGEGGVGPAPSGLHAPRSLAAIVEWIVKPSNKMPQLTPPRSTHRRWQMWQRLRRGYKPAGVRPQTGGWLRTASCVKP
jgi:hypothetical protein